MTLNDRLRDGAAVARSRAQRARARLENRVSIRDRLATLEAEAQENRQLNRRVAELTDVIAELLLPLSEQDPARAQQVLAAYRDKI